MKVANAIFICLICFGIYSSAYSQTDPSSESGQQIVLVPDIQQYSGREANNPLLGQQIQWLVDSIEEEQIAFITQLGDITHSGGADIAIPDQWKRTSKTFELLDSTDLPFSVAYGNHDFDIRGESDGSAVLAQQYFGATRYQNREWFGGSSPDGTSFYQFFQLEGQPMLHLALKFSPDIPTLKWANQLVQQHNIPTIISTHAYLTDAGAARGRGGNSGETIEAGREPIGEVIWNNLVKRNDQIFMVFCGHNHAGANVTVAGEYSEDGEYHQTSINEAGREVYEFLANYQDYPNGGDGWLQLLRFDTENNKLTVRTYSTYHEKFQTDALSNFELSINFRERWQL